MEQPAVAGHYQPSDEQCQSVVQVELRTLPASKIQIPAWEEKQSSYTGYGLVHDVLQQMS